MPRAKSVVWDFFTQTSDPKYAKCKMCNENKSLGSTKKREQTLTNFAGRAVSKKEQYKIKMIFFGYRTSSTNVREPSFSI